MLLGLLGAMPVEEPYITCARLATVFYFMFFVLVFCFSRLEDRFTKNLLLKLQKNLNKKK